MIPETFVKDIITKTEITDLISEYVDLTPSGAQLKGVCPFCKSKLFTVSPEKQIWKCFKCNKGGEAVKFIIFLKKVTFPKAIHLLAERLNIEVPVSE